MIKKILKLHPSLPKYVVTYDPNIILQYTDLLPANNRLSMDLLTKKLCILFCLLSGQRSQTITSIKIDRSVLAHIEDIYSTSMQFKKKKKAILGRHQIPLVFQSFEPDEKLCMID